MRDLTANEIVAVTGGEDLNCDMPWYAECMYYGLGSADWWISFFITVGEVMGPEPEPESQNYAGGIRG
jgi:hypothetical protein